MVADLETEAVSLTPSQAARRERVLRTALELGATGGYDAVQMRDVASSAGVALGTIYRYFESKDHLLAAAMVEWVADLERRVGQRPPKGDSVAERVMDVLARATRAVFLPLLVAPCWLAFAIAFGVRAAPTAVWLGAALGAGILA